MLVQPTHPVHIGSAPHHAGLQAVQAAVARPARSGLHILHQVRLNQFCNPPQLHWRQLAHLKRPAHSLVSGIGDQHRFCIGHVRQAEGDVHHLSHHRVIVLHAHITGISRPGMQTDPQLKPLQTRLLCRFGVVSNDLLDLKGSLHRSLGIVLAQGWHAPYRHHHIAHVFADVSTLLQDRPLQPRPGLPDNLSNRVQLHPLYQGIQPLDDREHHRHQAAFFRITTCILGGNHKQLRHLSCKDFFAACG